MSSKPDLSIIIVNWNTRQLLEGCLESIYSAPCRTTFEVWVVDNGSSDGSADMVRSRFPQVRLLLNAENLGYGKANNQAIRESAADTLLLLNSDTVVEPQVLDETLGLLRRRPDLGALGCTLIGADGQVQPSYAVRYPSGQTVGTFGQQDQDGVILCALVWGAYLMLKREVVDAIGCFDEDFFMFCEDIDLCWRITEAGWKIGYYPHCTVKHIGGASRQLAGTTWCNHYLVSSQYLLCLKHGAVKRFWAERRRRLVHHRWCAFWYRVGILIGCRPELADKMSVHQVCYQLWRRFDAQAVAASPRQGVKP